MPCRRTCASLPAAAAAPGVPSAALRTSRSDHEILAARGCSLLHTILTSRCIGRCSTPFSDCRLKSNAIRGGSSVLTGVAIAFKHVLFCFRPERKQLGASSARLCFCFEFCAHDFAAPYPVGASAPSSSRPTMTFVRCAARF